MNITHKMYKKIEELSSFAQSALSISRHMDSSGVLNELADAVRQVFQYDFLICGIFNSAGNLDVFYGYNSLFSDYLIREKNNFLFEASGFAETELKIDSETENVFEGIGGKMGIPPSSFLSFPLLAGTEKVGFFRVSCIREDAFKPEQTNYILSLTLHAALVLRNISLYEQVKRDKLQKELWLKSLYKIGNLIFDVEKLLSEISETIANVLNISDVYVFSPTLCGKNEMPEKYRLLSEKGFSEGIVRNDANTQACVPLMVKNRVEGFIGVSKEHFSDEDMQLVSFIAAHAAVAIETSKLYEIEVEKNTIERELQMAQQIQRSLLPKSVPQIEGIDIHAVFEPAKVIGGDYYDFFVNQDQLTVCVADVSGKSIPAAILMSMFRGIIRTAASDKASSSAVLTSANSLLCGDIESDRFVTAAAVTFDFKQKMVEIATAGHEPVLFYRPGAQTRWIFQKSAPCGIVKGFQYKSESFSFQSGDIIIVYTDGLTDSLCNIAREIRNIELEKIIDNCFSDSAEQITKQIYDAARKQVKPGRIDDLTFVVIKVGEI